MVQSVRPPGEGFDYKANFGCLLHIEVLGVELGVNTVHGPSDAVRANITPIDGADAGNTASDTLIFPKVLQSQLKGSIGMAVVGRLSQGQAKPGQSAPWVLNEATDAELAQGAAFEASRVSGPASAPPPAASQPAYQPPPAPAAPAAPAYAPPAAPAAPAYEAPRL